MRLQPAEQEAIRRACRDTLPAGSRVRLFGSRLDDTRRGGDIDLLIEFPQPLPAEELVHRLFHQEHPEALGSKPMSFACSCSHERVAAMLQSLGEEEARAAAEATGAVEVRCEFCGREYHFPLTEVEILFSGEGLTLPAPERLQ